MQQLAITVKQEVVQRALVVHGRYSHVGSILLPTPQCAVLRFQQFPNLSEL